MRPATPTRGPLAATTAPDTRSTGTPPTWWLPDSPAEPDNRGTPMRYAVAAEGSQELRSRGLPWRARPPELVPSGVVHALDVLRAGDRLRRGGRVEGPQGIVHS